MNPAALLIAGVFSYCTPDYCVMSPPLQVWPSPMARAAAAPPAITQDQQRELIIRQGEAFCRKFPTDKMCHFQDQPK
jgi:hypothetical protein